MLHSVSKIKGKYLDKILKYSTSWRLTNLLQDERGDTSYEGNKMKEILEQFNMKNVVKRPTRTEKIWSNKRAHVPWVSQITI